MHRSLRSSARSAAAIAFLTVACAASLATTAPAATPPPSESLAIFEAQLNGHQVSTVTLFPTSHTLHATLTDGHKVRTAFPPAQQQRLISDIRAKSIMVKIAKAQSPPSHKRRYIVGGVVIVVIVFAVVGWLLSARRRRMREDEEGPRASGRYSAGG